MKARNQIFFKRNYIECILKTDVWQCSYPYVILLPKRYKSATYKKKNSYISMSFLKPWSKDP